MSIGDQMTVPSAGAPKFDQRLAPDADGVALAAYRQSMELIYSVDFTVEAAARFFFRGMTYQLPTAVFADLASVAQTLSRGPAEIARQGDQFLIYAQIEGEIDADYAGHERKIRPGDVVMVDYSREIHSRATDFRMMYLMVARDRVPPLLLAASAHGTVFPGASGPGRLLYRTIETLLETADALTLGEADAAVDALLTMAAGLLESVLPQESGFGASGGCAARDLARLHRSPCREPGAFAGLPRDEPAVLALQPLSPVRASRRGGKRHSAAAS
jgi:hypothetical protein